MEKIVINDPEGTPTKHMIVPPNEVWFYKNFCVPSLGSYVYLPGESFFCPHRAIIVKMRFQEVLEIILADPTLKSTISLVLERMAKKLTDK